MSSVKFDNQELVGTTYIPRFVKHESATDRELNIQPLARDDGSVFISDRRGTKVILVQGILTAATEALLDAAIDSFKEIFARQEKNLDIEWAGGTRRYVATCKNHNFDRDHFNLLYVPWTAEFVVSSGVGKDTTLTPEKHAQAINANPYSWTSTFAGSAKPKPIVTIEVSTGFTKPRGILLENLTTGQKIIFVKSSAIANGDTIVIDFENKKVTLEGVEQPFYGVFPDMIIGDNSMRLTIGDILDQYTTEAGYTDEYLVHSDLYIAQQIVVANTDKSYKRLGIYMMKVGTPPNVMTVEIQTDNNGAPSGTKVDANATGSMVGGGSMAWVYIDFATNIELKANTPYWIVCKTTLGDTSNYYKVAILQGALATYAKGNVDQSVDAGVTWTENEGENFVFKLYYGGNQEAAPGNATLDVDYYKRYL